MNFDFILQNNNIDYGFVKGDNKIVFVKVGLGGDCLGYENRYLKIARQLKDKYGCSVIVSANPNDGKKHNNSDKKIIEQYVLENKIDLPKLFFFGNSNGGVKGLELTNDGVRFKKMILVNMPLMINFHKTKRYISAIPQTEIVAVYGEHDPSFRYLPFLDGIWKNVKILTVPKADHNFWGMSDEFIDLSDFIMNL